jgi:hypothetical protein
MKIIVHIKDSSRSARKTLAHCYGQGRSIKEVECQDRVVRLINGLEVGTPERNPAADAEKLLIHHHALEKAREVKHVVLSVENLKFVHSREKAVEGLAQAAQDYAAKYAPGCQYLAVIHQDREHVHAHLVICNSNGKRCIKWSPSHCREMQQITPWCSVKMFTPGKKQGLTCGELSSLSRRLEKTELAKLVKLSPKQIYDQFKDDPKTRWTEDGKRMISIEMNGKRIRISTIEQYRARNWLDRAYEHSQQRIKIPAEANTEPLREDSRLYNSLRTTYLQLREQSVLMTRLQAQRNTARAVRWFGVPYHLRKFLENVENLAYQAQLKKLYELRGKYQVLQNSAGQSTSRANRQGYFNQQQSSVVQTQSRGIRM